MEPGFELVATTVGLEARIAEVDVVITGEGRLDRQTLEGKGPAGVAKMVRAAGKPVLAFAGSIDECPELLERFDAVVPIVDRPVSLEEAMREAAPFIQRAAARTARWFQNPIFL
jgi:glycerate kinase